MHILYPHSNKAVRQKTQALIQQGWNEIGVATELKNIDAGVFFGPTDNPDSLSKFYADVQMFTNGNDNPDPQNYLSGWICDLGDGAYNIPNTANSFGGNATERWCSPEYDAKFAELQAATDLAERVRLAVELNDLLVQNNVILPLVYRASVSAHANSLLGIDMNGWDTEEWNIEDWSRAR